MAPAEEAAPQLWGQESRKVLNFLIKAGLSGEPSLRQKFISRVTEVIKDPAFLDRLNMVERETK